MKITVDLTDERNQVAAGTPKPEVLKDLIIAYVFGEIPEPEFLTDQSFLPCTREEIHQAFQLAGLIPDGPFSQHLYKDGTFSDDFMFDEDSPMADDDMYGCTSELMMNVSGDAKNHSFIIRFSNGCVKPSTEY